MFSIRNQLLTTAFVVASGTAFADPNPKPVHHPSHGTTERKHETHVSPTPPVHSHGSSSTVNPVTNNPHMPTTNNAEHPKTTGSTTPQVLTLLPNTEQHQSHQQTNGAAVTKPTTTVATTTSGTTSTSLHSSTTGTSTTGQHSQISSTANTSSQTVQTLLGRAIKELAAADMAVRVNATTAAEEDVRLAIHMIEQAAKLHHHHGRSHASNAAFGGMTFAAHQSHHNQSMHSLVRELSAVLHQIREGHLERAERDIRKSRQMIEKYLHHGHIA